MGAAGLTAIRAFIVFRLSVILWSRKAIVEIKATVEATITRQINSINPNTSPTGISNNNRLLAISAFKNHVAAIKALTIRHSGIYFN